MPPTRITPAGGARRDRTDDLLLAKQALSQLSYGPGERTMCSKSEGMVGLGRFELPTSRLSSARSNQLSYKPGPRASYQQSVISRLLTTNYRSLIFKGSSAKKEKRRRRCPANGALTGLLMFLKRSDSDERMLASEGSSLERR